jgi:hypothetical protein
MVFRVLGDPQAGDGFQCFKGLASPGFGIDLAEIAANVGLGR